MVHSRPRSLRVGQLEEIPLLAYDDDDVQAAVDDSAERSAVADDSDEQSAAADGDAAVVGGDDVMALPAPTSPPLTQPT